ncbi:hypothetical protein KGM_206697 [Danaus plexippus plexippus]|uniref:Uncharacterized protein n=1 Tax=Danaus plexippus plexippus TaxID=278856 RepID=A0A212EM45_DANPL|nr:hypothetical protein KGM_206697 [Danaus plexippus plexippus]
MKSLSKWRWCEVETMCGRSLKEGVMFVGLSSLLISIVLLFSSVRFLWTNTQPMMAVNLIFSLMASCLSLYQIVISILLVWQTRQIKGNIFLCSLWYVSHLSLLTIYCLLFISKIVVYCQYQDYSAAALTIAIGIIYEVTFTYFAIVVNSYLHSLNQERYL